VAHEIEIKLDGMGRGSIVLDGINLSHLARGVEIINDVEHATEIRLRLAKGRAVDLAATAANLELEGDCPHCHCKILVKAK